MKFSNYFLKKKIQTLLVRSLNRTHHFCPLDESRSILLMFHIHDWNLVEPGMKQLKELGCRVLLCAYIPCGFEAKTEASWLKVEEEKDTNSWKIPTNEICKRINEQTVDILIDLTRANDYVMHYLLLQHPTQFKVGQKVYVQTMHDFEIAMTESNDIGELFKQILFYLQTIRTK